MEQFKMLTENQIIVSILLLIAGGLIAHLFSKIRNKTGIIKYFTLNNQVGLSADDSIFGSVRVTWQGQEVRNLHFYSIEVENSTANDYENIDLKIYCGNDTVILNEKTEVVDEPYILKWAPSFRNTMDVPEGNEPTQLQIDAYNHRREYAVDVFNRGQKLRFFYLCTRPNDNLEPVFFISTLKKSIKLKSTVRPYITIRPIWGVPIVIALSRAIIIALLALIICGLFIKSVWLASLICMIVGLSAQLLGAAEYKIERSLAKLISG